MNWYLDKFHYDYIDRLVGRTCPCTNEIVCLISVGLVYVCRCGYEPVAARESVSNAYRFVLVYGMQIFT